MNENKMMRQMGAIFSAFMVFFYLGIGIYLIFFFDTRLTTLQKPVLVIFGSVCIFYGLYRAYATYVTIVNLFFKPDDDE
ncbi:MAG TPA: hypothetical protein DCY25_00880 [Bacteroidales bacterium]|nr:hypothetical protein [Bacteroidales bacterium]